MNSLTHNDLQFVASRLPKDVAQVVRENGVVVAGGFIRSTISQERVSDIDLFAADKGELEKVAYKMATERRGRVHKTDNALTVLAPPRIPVQFITRWVFSKPADVVESFDFTVCQAGIWFVDGRFHSAVSDGFYPDLAARRLIYTSPKRNEDAGGSLLRVRKFLARGYSIQSGSLGAVIARLVKGIDQRQVDLADEVMVSKILTGLLREVDPLTVVDGVDVVDEHEVVEPVQAVSQ